MEECNGRAYLITASNSRKSASQAKVQHDKKAHSITLLSGDRVLVKNFEKGGPGKIHSYWEQTVYRVVRQLNDGAPVYTVEPENGNGKQHTLHHTLLLPCDSLPIDNPEDIPLHTSRKNCQKQHRWHQPTKKEVADHPFASLDNSSEDEETLTFYPCDLEMKPSTSCTGSNEADITTSVATELLPESSDRQQYFDSPDNQEATHENPSYWACEWFFSYFNSGYSTWWLWVICTAKCGRRYEHFTVTPKDLLSTNTICLYYTRWASRLPT